MPVELVPNYFDFFCGREVDCAVVRDRTERQQTEENMHHLNQDLERQVDVHTAQLAAMVEVIWQKQDGTFI